jgi:hypothetical protein
MSPFLSALGVTAASGSVEASAAESLRGAERAIQEKSSGRSRLQVPTDALGSGKPGLISLYIYYWFSKSILLLMTMFIL